MTRSADHQFVFEFPTVQWKAGKLTAVGINGDQPVCRSELDKAGPPLAITITPILGPTGLHADGGDVALFDVEVVDSTGRRCPTDEARIDFTLTGEAVWRGGYNGGIVGSTNNLFLNTECGINRVAIRSTRVAGPIKLTATRAGLVSAGAELRSIEGTDR